MLVIDASQLEGGQALRSALSLSIVTQQPFSMRHIRITRERPGMKRAHVAVLRAAAAICGGEISGDHVGSREISFVPGSEGPKAGFYAFHAGLGGNAGLMLQTLLPALMLGWDRSELLLQGEMFGAGGPSFDFLVKTFLPLIARMGPRVEAQLVSDPGSGEIRMRVKINPVQGLVPLELMDCGTLRRKLARAVVGGEGSDIAQRQLEFIGERVGWGPECLRVEKESMSGSPANRLVVEMEGEEVTEVITGAAQRRLSPHDVAESVVRQTRRYLRADAPVGEHLADQLMLPLAMAGGGTYRTVRQTAHMTTNMQIIGRFLEIGIGIDEFGPSGMLVWLTR